MAYQWRNDQPTTPAMQEQQFQDMQKKVQQQRDNKILGGNNKLD